MASALIDLHMHTTHSDGLLTPEEVLQMVCRRKLAVFSITDHDTLEGYRAVAELMSSPPTGLQESLQAVPDLELMTGVELSVMVGAADTDVHLLAYAFDAGNSKLNEALEGFQERRNRRGQEIVQRLNDMGLPVSFDTVLEKAGDGVVGRPHIAEALVASGSVENYEIAFQRYIGKDSPAYVAKGYFTPEEAIDMVHHAGGVTVLAHPSIDDTGRFLEELAEMGLDGVEVYHPRLTQSDTVRYKHLAERYRLLITGGSDFHGRESRNGAIGSQPVHIEIAESIKQRARQHRGHQ